MPSIQKATHLVNTTFIANMGAKSRVFNTPMIFGNHGIGKSQIARILAERHNGVYYVIDGTTIKEGELTGMPFAVESKHGGLETNFAPHWVIRAIQKIESDMIDVLTTNAEKIKIVQDILKTDATGEKLARMVLDANGDKRLALFNKRDGIFKPVFVLLDEINRCSREVNQELMNFTLNRTMNGYDLPWFVQVIGAANPSGGAYSSEDMDPAQIDRIYKIDVVANVEEWVQWGMKNGQIHKVILQFISDTGRKFFQMDQDAIDQGSQKANVSPRSWENVSSILFTFDNPVTVNMIGDMLKTDESLKLDKEEILYELIEAKVGSEATHALRTYLNDKENFVKPEEIFALRGTIDMAIKAKIKRMSSLRCQVLVESVLDYFADSLETKLNSMSDSDKARFDDELYEFHRLLDASNRLVFGVGWVNRMLERKPGEKPAKLYTLAIKQSNKLNKFKKELLEIVKNHDLDSDLVASN